MGSYIDLLCLGALLAVIVIGGVASDRARKRSSGDPYIDHLEGRDRPCDVCGGDCGQCAGPIHLNLTAEERARRAHE